MRENLRRRIASIESFVSIYSSRKLSSYSDQQLFDIICDHLGKAGEEIRSRGIEELSDAQLLSIMRGF